MSQPILYIVSTPIGNLSDFSYHAQTILSSVSFILCEDTRHTLKLLNHFQIKNNLESLHVHNEKNKLHYLLEKLIHSETKSAALVSDAGTPAICDPGSYLVAAAHEKGVRVVLVPGPSSMPSAIAASGFVQPRTVFSGFLPKAKADQIAEFKIWAQASPCIAVFFESPRRVAETLTNIVQFFSGQLGEQDGTEIEICVSREISKKFEEHRRSFLGDALSYYESQKEIQGEFVLCLNLNKIVDKEKKVSLEFAAKESVLMSKLHNTPLKSCCKELSEKYGYPSKEIYALASQITI